MTAHTWDRIRALADRAAGTPLSASVLVVVGLWALLWVGLSAAPLAWPPARETGWFNPRSWVPLVVLAGSITVLWRGRDRAGSSPAAWLLVGYGLVGAFASLVASPLPFHALFWALLYLAVPASWLAATRVRGSDAWRAVFQFNAWACLGLTALFVAVAQWQYEFFETMARGRFERVYSPIPDVPLVALAASSNGVGRLASIAALVALARAFATRGFAAAAWGIAAGLAALLAVHTFSRGAVVSLAAGAMVIVVLCAGRRGLLVAGAAALLGAALLGPAAVGEFFERRGVPFALSGRERIWGQAWDLVRDSPWVGHGFHADRLLLAEHVHNAWLHALVQSGFLGGLLFVAAWWLAARAGVRLARRAQNDSLDPPTRGFVVEATAILAFLAMRSLVESSGAFYGVDLLLLVPTMGVLALVERRSRVEQAFRSETPTREGRDHVLVCAYACAPPESPTFHGGEDLLGWRVVNQLAREYDVWAMTSAHHRSGIEAALRNRPVPGLRFVYLDLPRPLHGLRRVQGGIQLYAYLWQVRAWWAARDFLPRAPWRAFHHVTYANDWMASYMGAFLPIPYVRGPGGGAHRVPPSLLADRSLRFRLVQALRTALQRLLRADPVFRIGRRRCATHLVCMQESVQVLPSRLRTRARLFPVNGVDSPARAPPTPVEPVRPLRIVAVGKLLGIKGFDFAIRAFARFEAAGGEGRLRIVGDGPERHRLARLSDGLGVGSRVEFLGWRDRAEVLRELDDADLLLFPSLRDGGGAVVVESMARARPVVCLDVGGPGYHVDPTCGIKVAPGSPDTVVDGLAGALRRLYVQPGLRRSLAEGALRKAESTYLWNQLGDELHAVLRDAMGHGTTDGRTGFTAPHASPGREPGPTAGGGAP